MLYWNDCTLSNVLKYVDNHVFLLSRRFLQVGAIHLNERIKQKMAQAKRIDPNIMNEKLIESKGVLSGGCLLDIFVHNKPKKNKNICIEEGDVDIYFRNGPDKTPLELYLTSLVDVYCEHCNYVGLCQDSSHTKKLKMSISQLNAHYIMYLDGIDRIINIQINDIKYQLIYLRDSIPSIDYHINSFDYACLHNTYDGKKVSLSYRCDILNQCARKINSYPRDNNDRRRYRIIKYLKKGFNVIENTAREPFLAKTFYKYMLLWQRQMTYVRKFV